MTPKQIAQLKQNAKANIYIAHGDKSEADCVIAFSFGYRELNGQIIPGKSNQQLAKFIDENFTGTPLIVQFEIDDAFEEHSADLVIRESRDKGEYLHSREIAEQALIFMNSKGWRTAAIVTHSAMMARNDAMCAKLGIKIIAPTGLEQIAYDELSAQEWTRNKASWWKRENEVIDIFVENGWL